MEKRNAALTTNDPLARGRTTPVQSRPAMRVECPGEGEAISRPYYTLQITAMLGGGVDVSIDQGDWLPCREALGFWWFDWSGFDAGPHELTVRTRVGEGLALVSGPRRFTAL